MRAGRPRPASGLPKLVAVVGSTASGKTDLSVALAKTFGGEIISADSRQLYKGTEIGSDIIAGRWSGRGARRAYRARGVRHHLIAFLRPSETLTLAEYKVRALAAARGIAERGKVPFLVGGTGLYVRAVVDNLRIPEVPPDPSFRRRMEKLPTSKLFAMLRRKDPAYAARIPKNNRRYAIRALEVIAKTGRPFSELQGADAPLFEALLIGVSRPREELYRRVDARVDAQMRRGLLAETKRLRKRLPKDAPALTGLGHRQIGLFLDGKVPLDEAVRLIKRDTRHYARRQMTWFRADRRVAWVKGEAEAVRVVRAFLGARRKR